MLSKYCLGSNVRSRIVSSTVAVIIILIALKLIDMTEAGTCWDKRLNSGKCKQPLMRNISEIDCCSSGVDVAFSEKEMNDYEFFFATTGGSDITCSSCIESCQTAQCPIGKRCVMRNGQPKCICSPNCKSTSKKGGKNIAIVKVLHNNLNKSFEINNTNYNKQTNKRDTIKNSKIITNNNNGQTFLTNRNLRISDYKNNLNNNNNNKRLIKNIDRINSTIIANNNNNNIKKYELNKIKNQLKRSTLNERIRLNFYGQLLVNPLNEYNKDDQDDPYFKPVCGTDGRTYKTECQLKKRSCRKDISTLYVAYKGYCQTSCAHVQCPNGMHCLEDQNLMPHCVTCNTKCPPYDTSIIKTSNINPTKLICGVDGITYRNLCEIKRAACLSGRSIPVAYRGRCKDENINCNNIKCKDRQICLSDLITHRPRCVSCRFKCQRKRNKKFQQENQNEQIQLCGMNNFTYYSWCQIIRDSCNTGYFIDVKHNGICINSTM